MLQLFVTMKGFLKSQKLWSKDRYLRSRITENVAVSLRWKGIYKSCLTLVSKLKNKVTQVATDLQSNSPWPRKVESERICVFCRKTKYLKETKTREALIQCVDLRADNTIKRAAVGKNNPQILAIVMRELVAAEACYHKSCYCDNTQNVQEAVSDTKEEDVYWGFLDMSPLHDMQLPKPKCPFIV